MFTPYIRKDPFSYQYPVKLDGVHLSFITVPYLSISKYFNRLTLGFSGTWLRWDWWYGGFYPYPFGFNGVYNWSDVRRYFNFFLNVKGSERKYNQW